MRVEKRAYTMAKMAVGNSEDALDLVQDAMMAFVTRYADRLENDWPALFFRILQNGIRDWYRRSRVRNRWRVWFNRFADEGDNILETIPDDKAVDPLVELSNEGLNDAIITALKILPLRQQQVFLLRIWEGLSVAETATAMVCSQGSVKTHLSRALQALRSSLDEYRL